MYHHRDVYFSSSSTAALKISRLLVIATLVGRAFHNSQRKSGILLEIIVSMDLTECRREGGITWKSDVGTEWNQERTWL